MVNPCLCSGMRYCKAGCCFQDLPAEGKFLFVRVVDLCYEFFPTGFLLWASPFQLFRTFPFSLFYITCAYRAVNTLLFGYKN